VRSAWALAGVAAGWGGSPVGAHKLGNSSALPGGGDIGVPVGQPPDHGAVGPSHQPLRKALSK